MPSLLIQVFISCLLFAASLTQADTSLTDLRKQGFIRCGIHSSLPGFSVTTGNDQWQGLEVDFCRALSISLFNNPHQVKWHPISRGQGYAQLQSGDIDILVRQSPWTPELDTSLGLLFTQPLYFNSQALMVRTTDIDALKGQKVCTTEGGTLPEQLQTQDLRRQDYPASATAGQAFLNELCAAYLAPSSDVYRLLNQQAQPDTYTILAQYAPTPTGPVIRGGDIELLKLTRLLIQTLLSAERLGLNQANAKQLAEQQTPAAVQLLELTLGGILLGLPADNSINLIDQLGNYGELFQRHLGQPYGLPRGYNDLANDGGLHWQALLPKLPEPAPETEPTANADNTKANPQPESASNP